MKHIDKIDKEKGSLKLELQSAAVAVQHARSELAEKEHECRQLYRSLADEERKCTKTEKKVEGVQNEKDQIGTEIMKKKGEIGSMKDRVQLMQRALDQGILIYSIRAFPSHTDFSSLCVQLRCNAWIEWKT